DLRMPDFRNYAVEVPSPGAAAAYTKQAIRDKLIEHTQYIHEHGEDMPEIVNWQWKHRGSNVIQASRNTAADF
ncbi:MAG: phosphoketolase family protein, partial [Candidatus Binatia bacterium]